MNDCGGCCRLCLVTLSKIDLFLNTHKENVDILQNVSKLFGVEITESTRWPKNVCTKCSNKVKKMLEFKSEVSANQIKIQKFILLQDEMTQYQTEVVDLRDDDDVTVIEIPSSRDLLRSSDQKTVKNLKLLASMDVPATPTKSVKEADENTNKIETRGSKRKSSGESKETNNSKRRKSDELSHSTTVNMRVTRSRSSLPAQNKKITKPTAEEVMKKVNTPARISQRRKTVAATCCNVFNREELELNQEVTNKQNKSKAVLKISETAEKSSTAQIGKTVSKPVEAAKNVPTTIAPVLDATNSSKNNTTVVQKYVEGNKATLTAMMIALDVEQLVAKDTTAKRASAPNVQTTTAPELQKKAIVEDAKTAPNNTTTVVRTKAILIAKKGSDDLEQLVAKDTAKKASTPKLPVEVAKKLPTTTAPLLQNMAIVEDVVQNKATLLAKKGSDDFKQFVANHSAHIRPETSKNQPPKTAQKDAAPKNMQQDDAGTNKGSKHTQQRKDVNHVGILQNATEHGLTRNMGLSSSAPTRRQFDEKKIQTFTSSSGSNSPIITVIPKLNIQHSSTSNFRMIKSSCGTINIPVGSSISSSPAVQTCKDTNKAMNQLNSKPTQNQQVVKVAQSKTPNMQYLPVGTVGLINSLNAAAQCPVRSSVTISAMDHLQLNTSTTIPHGIKVMQVSTSCSNSLRRSITAPQTAPKVITQNIRCAYSNNEKPSKATTAHIANDAGATMPRIKIKSPMQMMDTAAARIPTQPSTSLSTTASNGNSNSNVRNIPPEVQPITPNLQPQWRTIRPKSDIPAKTAQKQPQSIRKQIAKIHNTTISIVPEANANVFGPSYNSNARTNTKTVQIRKVMPSNIGDGIPAYVMLKISDDNM